MKNRIPSYLPLVRQDIQPAIPAFQEWQNRVHKQAAKRMRQVERLVQKHPVTGVGAAFCLGIVLGWIIKRR